MPTSIQSDAIGQAATVLVAVEALLDQLTASYSGRPSGRSSMASGSTA